MALYWNCYCTYGSHNNQSHRSNIQEKNQKKFDLKKTIQLSQLYLNHLNRIVQRNQLKTSKC